MCFSFMSDVSDVEEEEEGNDWLFTVIADIITAHNDMVELPKQVASQPFSRLLPDEQAKAYPQEITTANCIIPQFKRFSIIAIGLFNRFDIDYSYIHRLFFFSSFNWYGIKVFTPTGFTVSMSFFSCSAVVTRAPSTPTPPPPAPPLSGA